MLVEVIFITKFFLQYMFTTFFVSPFAQLVYASRRPIAAQLTYGIIYSVIKNKYLRVYVS